MIKGCIFDFNGTMFFDGAKHDFAWRRYLEQRLGRQVTREELLRYVYGRPSNLILEHFLGTELSQEERLQAASEKEALYRKLCMEDPAGLHLADGLVEYLDELRHQHMQLAIASAANRENIDFYFSVFGLDRWFCREHVVYDDGTLSGKPAPDYFQEASRRLGLPPQACRVFEDSVSGVLAAHRAKIGSIVAVYGDSDAAMLREQGLAQKYIRDFTGMTVENETEADRYEE